MSAKNFPLLFSVALSAALFPGCATGPKAQLERQSGESVVFIGEVPAALTHHPLPGQPILVRSTYLPMPGTVDYVEGRDYAVDYASDTLHRLPGSRLPDFRKNMLFDQQDF